MEIYSVKILFKYEIEDSDRAIYEESLRLFYAESLDEAFDKAKKWLWKRNGNILMFMPEK